jgi:hypothetical protein
MGIGKKKAHRVSRQANTRRATTTDPAERRCAASNSSGASGMKARTVTAATVVDIDPASTALGVANPPVGPVEGAKPLQGCATVGGGASLSTA